MNPTAKRLLERLDDETLERALASDAASLGETFLGEDGLESDGLADFGALCRAALDAEAAALESGDVVGAQASEGLREKRVAQKVLARTTREDLRRRGDVGLVLDFVSERMRQSVLLRVAAALLLVQMTVVPLMAWHMFRQPEKAALNFSFEPAPKDVADEVPPSHEGADVGGGIETLEGFDDLASVEAEDTAALRQRLDASSAGLRGAAVPEPTTALGVALRRLVDLEDATVWSGAAPSLDVQFRSAGILAWASLMRYEGSGETAGLATALETLNDLRASWREGGLASSTGALELCDRALAHAWHLDLALPVGLSPDRIMLGAGSNAQTPLIELLSQVVSGDPNQGPYVRHWVASER